MPEATHDLRPSQKAGRWEEKLETYLEANGLKHSEQRLKIMNFILMLPGHFTAQHIAREIQAESPGLGAATVYRNLKTLCEAGILRETLVDQEGQMVYEMVDDDHHDHIVCLDCNEIFEFHDPSIEDVQHKISKKMQFTEVQHRHVIYARCEFKSQKAKA